MTMMTYEEEAESDRREKSVVALCAAAVCLLPTAAFCLLRASSTTPPPFSTWAAVVAMASGSALFTFTSPGVPVWVAKKDLQSALRAPGQFTRAHAVAVAYAFGSVLGAVMLAIGAVVYVRWALATPARTGWEHTARDTALFAAGGMALMVSVSALASLRGIVNHFRSRATISHLAALTVTVGERLAYTPEAQIRKDDIATAAATLDTLLSEATSLPRPGVQASGGNLSTSRDPRSMTP